MTAPGRVHAWSGRFVAAAVLQVPAGVTVLTVVMGIGTVDGLAICFSATSTPMALFIGLGLIACGVSTWAQPTTRVLTGPLDSAFSLVALLGANLGGFLLGTVLGVLGSTAALAWSPGERRSTAESTTTPSTTP